MVSRIMFVIVALSFISFGCGYLVKRDPGQFEQVMGCFKKALDNSYQAMLKGNMHDALCYYKWMNPCVINLEQVIHPGTEPLLDIVVASLWQELTFVHQLGLCLDYSTANLKTYTLKSGIMTKMGLHNIEKDDMKPCAQKALLNCTFTKQNLHASLASMFEASFKCVKKTAKTCKAPIWQHFLKTVEALKKEFEKNRGKFNKFFLKIRP